MKERIGFIMALLGCAGMSEAFGSVSQTTISALLLIIGGILLYRGLSNEKQNIGGTDDSINRPYYLPRS
jgi:hypothetical protein